jgi:eukaryotic-like serine/threonine-protein kinase
MQAKSGALVSGRYRLEEPLASGGMGTVWRAFHMELEIEVAVKLLSTELLRTPTGEKRFRREAQAAAKLKSPNIVQVIDYGVFEDQPFLVMELLQGEDLATRIDAGKLSPDECLGVIEGVAKALHVAHEQGIIHRDLKPGNIFLERAGDEEIVKVLDFGIAKDLRAKAGTKAGTTGAALIGSPGYMSPEQVWADEVSVETDTWAMTLVAYEMLTQTNPFHHEVLAQMFDRIVKAKVPSAREHTPELPESIDAFFERGLARDASDRFPSAKAVAEAFREALGYAPLGPPSKARVATALQVRSTNEASGTLAEHVTKDALPPKASNGWIWAGFGALVVAAISFALFSPRAGEPTESLASAPVIPSEAPRSPTAPQPSVNPPETSASASVASRRPAATTLVPGIKKAAPAPVTTSPVPSSTNRWGVPVP